MTDEIELSLDSFGHLTPAEAVGLPVFHDLELEELRELPLEGTIEHAAGQSVRIRVGTLTHHCRSGVSWRYEDDDSDEGGHLVKVVPFLGRPGADIGNPEGVRSTHRIPVKLYSVKLPEVPGRTWRSKTLWFSDVEEFAAVDAAADEIEGAYVNMDRTLQHRWKKRA